MRTVTRFRKYATITVGALALGLLSAILMAFQADGGGSLSNEYLVKAAFVYKLALFVNWPGASFPRNDSPILIGILGQDPIGDAIDQAVRDKTAGNRHFVVRRVRPGAELRNCHILFIASSQAANLEKVRGEVKDTPVLTIGETASFARDGGIISLLIENNRVGLEVNIEAAKQANLAISSKLLSLARIIH